MCPNTTCSTNAKWIVSPGHGGIACPWPLLSFCVCSRLCSTSHFTVSPFCRFPFHLRSSLRRTRFVDCCRMPSFFSPPIFVASLNPADLCLNLLMAIIDPAPSIPLGGNGVDSPLWEVSPEELLNLLVGHPGAQHQPQPCLQEDGGEHWETAVTPWL